MVLIKDLVKSDLKMPLFSFLSKEKKQDRAQTSDMTLPPPPPPLRGSSVYSDLPVFPSQKVERLPGPLDELENNSPPEPVSFIPVEAPRPPVLEPTPAEKVESKLYVHTAKLALVEESLQDVAARWPRELPGSMEAVSSAEDQKLAELQADLEIVRKRVMAVDQMIFESR